MWPSEFVTYVSVTHIRIRFRYPKKGRKGNESVTQEREPKTSGELIAARFLCPSTLGPSFQSLG
jgi:hypothetical protein